MRARACAGLRGVARLALLAAARAWDPTPHYEMAPCRGGVDATSSAPCQFHPGTKVRARSAPALSLLLPPRLGLLRLSLGPED
eukprot:COSAG04_NODE_14747_length_556_cov_1.407002_1_plen_82_part_10